MTYSRLLRGRVLKNDNYQKCFYSDTSKRKPNEAGQSAKEEHESESIVDILSS